MSKGFPYYPEKPREKGESRENISLTRNYRIFQQMSRMRQRAGSLWWKEIKSKEKEFIFPRTWEPHERWKNQEESKRKTNDCPFLSRKTFSAGDGERELGEALASSQGSSVLLA